MAAAFARAGALDVWQPDITWCGGITAGLRIVKLARQTGTPVVPHRGGEPWGLHLIAGTECEPLAEMVLGKRYAPRDELWLDAPFPRDGRVEVGDAPGFGVRLGEDLLQSALVSLHGYFATSQEIAHAKQKRSRGRQSAQTRHFQDARCFTGDRSGRWRGFLRRDRSGLVDRRRGCHGTSHRRRNRQTAKVGVAA